MQLFSPSSFIDVTMGQLPMSYSRYWAGMIYKT